MDSLGVQIKDVTLEIDTLKSRREVELAEMERGKRHALAEGRLKRGEIAQELRQARRAYHDQLREKEHELYLLRLKVDLRSKRIEELIEAKRHEFDTYEKGAAERAERTLNSLKSKIHELLAARDRRTLEIENLRSKRGVASDELDKARRSLGPEGLGPEEFIALQARARGQLESFKSRMDELFKTREAERARLIQIAGQIEPMNRELSMSLTGLLMSWETQMRRMENLIKGIEESPFWRH